MCLKNPGLIFDKKRVRSTLQLANEDLQKLINYFEGFRRIGYLSKEDIMQGFLECGHEFSDEEFKEMIKEVGNDGDDKIRVKEFIEYWLKGLTMTEKIKYGILTFCLTPFLPLILSLKLQNLYLMESTNGDITLYKQKAMLKYHLYSMAKLELGFEAIYQIGEENLYHVQVNYS